MKYDPIKLMDTINQVHLNNKNERAKTNHFSAEILKTSVSNSDKGLKIIKEEANKTTTRIKR